MVVVFVVSMVFALLAIAGFITALAVGTELEKREKFTEDYRKWLDFVSGLHACDKSLEIARVREEERRRFGMPLAPLYREVPFGWRDRGYVYSQTGCSCLVKYDPRFEDRLAKGSRPPRAYRKRMKRIARERSTAC